MNRYFMAKCDEDGQPIEEEIIEIAPPMHYVLLPFCFGIFVGCLLMTLLG